MRILQLAEKYSNQKQKGVQGVSARYKARYIASCCQHSSDFSSFQLFIRSFLRVNTIPCYGLFPKYKYRKRIPVFFGAPEETQNPDLLIRSHKSKQITICNLLTLRVMENVE